MFEPYEGKLRILLHTGVVTTNNVKSGTCKLLIKSVAERDYLD